MKIPKVLLKPLLFILIVIYSQVILAGISDDPLDLTLLSNYMNSDKIEFIKSGSKVTGFKFKRSQTDSKISMVFGREPDYANTANEMDEFFQASEGGHRAYYAADLIESVPLAVAVYDDEAMFEKAKEEFKLREGRPPVFKNPDDLDKVYELREEISTARYEEILIEAELKLLEDVDHIYFDIGGLEVKNDSGEIVRMDDVTEPSVDSHTKELVATVDNSERPLEGLADYFAIDDRITPKEYRHINSSSELRSKTRITHKGVPLTKDQTTIITDKASNLMGDSNHSDWGGVTKDPLLESYIANKFCK